MKTILLVVFLMIIASVANAVKVDELSGMWLIKSFQEINEGKLITADGTDFWEFTDSSYVVHASGFKFSETEYLVNDNHIVIKKNDGDKIVKIESFEGDAMKVSDGKYFYVLVKQ